jgi:hypothetical protein
LAVPNTFLEGPTGGRTGRETPPSPLETITGVAAETLLKIASAAGATLIARRGLDGWTADTGRCTAPTGAIPTCPCAASPRSMTPASLLDGSAVNGALGEARPTGLGLPVLRWRADAQRRRAEGISLCGIMPSEECCKQAVGASSGRGSTGDSSWFALVGLSAPALPAADMPAFGRVRYETTGRRAGGRVGTCEGSGATPCIKGGPCENSCCTATASSRARWSSNAGTAPDSGGPSIGTGGRRTAAACLMRRAWTLFKMRTTCERCSSVCGDGTPMGHNRKSWQRCTKSMASRAGKPYASPSMTAITVPVRP